MVWAPGKSVRAQRRSLIWLGNSPRDGGAGNGDHNYEDIFHAFNQSLCIAWVETNPETIGIDQFIEDVLVNRGFSQMKLFSELSAAQTWLLGDKKANSAV